MLRIFCAVCVHVVVTQNEFIWIKKIQVDIVCCISTLELTTTRTFWCMYSIWKTYSDLRVKNFAGHVSDVSAEW